MPALTQGIRDKTDRPAYQSGQQLDFSDLISGGIEVVYFFFLKTVLWYIYWQNGKAMKDLWVRKG